MNDASYRQLLFAFYSLLALSACHFMLIMGMAPAVFAFLYDITRQRGLHRPFGVIVSTAIVCVTLSLPALIQFSAAYNASKKQQLWLCRAAAMAACFPVLSPILILGIPFGVWAIVLLYTPAVEAFFERSPQSDTKDSR